MTPAKTATQIDRPERFHVEVSDPAEMHEFLERAYGAEVRLCNGDSESLAKTSWRTHPTTGSEPMTDPDSARAARDKWHRWRELAQEELDDIDPGDPSKEYERAKAAAWLQHSEREYDKVAAFYDQF